MTGQVQKKRVVIEYIPTSRFNPSLEFFRQTISARVDEEWKDDFWASINILQDCHFSIYVDEDFSLKAVKQVSYTHVHNNVSFNVSYNPLDMSHEDYKRLSEEIQDVYKVFFYNGMSSWDYLIGIKNLLPYINQFNKDKVFVKCIKFSHNGKVVEV